MTEKREPQAEKLLPDLDKLLEDIKSRESDERAASSDVEVPEHIAKTCHGIQSFGLQWADAIEAVAKKQLEEDTKRYEQSMALANRIRQDAEEEARHVESWAMRTRSAGIGIKDVIERLNGHGVENHTAEKP
jgi:hypothetical protein